MTNDIRLSLPPYRARPPRPLSPDEQDALVRVANVLIPGADDMPAPSQLSGYARWLDRALAARAESFEQVIAVAGQLRAVADDRLEGAVRRLSTDDAEAFNALSAVLAGAYLMIPEVRRTIGYPGQERSHPPFDLAADEIMDGILDPVIARGPIYTQV